MCCKSCNNKRLCLGSTSADLEGTGSRADYFRNLAKKPILKLLDDPVFAMIAV